MRLRTLYSVLHHLHERLILHCNEPFPTTRRGSLHHAVNPFRQRNTAGLHLDFVTYFRWFPTLLKYDSQQCPNQARVVVLRWAGLPPEQRRSLLLPE